MASSSTNDEEEILGTLDFSTIRYTGAGYGDWGNACEMLGLLRDSDTPLIQRCVVYHTLRTFVDSKNEPTRRKTHRLRSPGDAAWLFIRIGLVRRAIFFAKRSTPTLHFGGILDS